MQLGMYKKLCKTKMHRIQNINWLVFKTYSFVPILVSTNFEETENSSTQLNVWRVGG